MKTGWIGGVYYPVTETETAECEFCGAKFERPCWVKRKRIRFCHDATCTFRRAQAYQMSREKPVLIKASSHCDENIIKKDYKGT